MYQKIIIVGNLGRDPVMRYTPAGDPVTNFSVAVNSTHSGADGAKIKETTWFRCSTWGKQAENCNQYLHKGSRVLVEGKLQSDPKTGGPKVFTRDDSTSGAAFEIRAFVVQFLSTKQEDEGYAAGAEGAAEYAQDPDSGAPATSGATDDIPF
jgi:single-strand DNA-binding protein